MLGVVVKRHDNAIVLLEMSFEPIDGLVGEGWGGEFLPPRFSINYQRKKDIMSSLLLAPYENPSQNLIVSEFSNLFLKFSRVNADY